MMSSAEVKHNQPFADSLSGREKFFDRLFRGMSYGFAWLTILLVIYIVFQIALEAFPAIRDFGPSFIVGKVWDRNQESYGILPQIWGTLYTSIIAVIGATIFGVAVAVFLNEGFLAGMIFRFLKLFSLQFHPLFRRIPDIVENIFKNLIQLLAAIPSVVYGLWGIYVVIPMIRDACNWIHNDGHGIGSMWFFNTPLSGKGVLPASMVLAIMILPTIAAIAQEALASVNPRLREASYGLGATRWETIFGVILPTAAPGIFAGIILAFGRALGETMALAMLAGSTNTLSLSLFSPIDTLAALLANNFPEASTVRDRSVLMYAALVLLAITMIVNMMGAFVLQRATAKIRGAKK
jgi:phosphate transport system permease protein